MPKTDRGRPDGRPNEGAMRTPSRGSDVQLLTLDELCNLLRMSRSSVERAIRSNQAFPQPLKMPGGRLIRFIRAEVLAYIHGLERAEYTDHAFDPNFRSDEADG